MFVASVRALAVLPDVDDFRGLMLEALSEPWARPSEVGAIVSNLLEQDKGLKPYIDRASSAWPGGPSDHQLLDPTDIAAISGHQLLCCLLRSTPVVGIELERFLTALRRAILSHALTSPPVDEDQLKLCCALAYQCFLNEYVLATTQGELERAASLRNLLAGKIESGAPVPAIWVAAAASYFPLHSLPNVGALLSRQWPREVADLLNQQVREPDEERQLRAAIPTLTPVEGDVSLVVRQHYEESPYPRWVKTEPPHRVSNFDQQMRVKFPLSRFRKLGKAGAIDILIAGCGTGRHVIEAAQSILHARILAVDLSLSSLAYAKRKARESGLGNVEFAQADILRLGSTGRRFDIIEAGGVLHHLGDPFAGWLALLSLLQPRGCMRLGLYSELARRDIVAARAFVVERGYGPTADDIRRCRQEILNVEQGTMTRNVAGTADFYTISECRDLLFHVQEHRLRLPEIARFINGNHLEFLGFEVSPGVLRQYQARFPHDRETRRKIRTASSACTNSGYRRAASRDPDSRNKHRVAALSNLNSWSE
jgi:SAM-dependent methyltransferase